jgi:hypothetical protein
MSSTRGWSEIQSLESEVRSQQESPQRGTKGTAVAEGQNVVIEVTATDRPGHKTTKTQAR